MNPMSLLPMNRMSAVIGHRSDDAGVRLLKIWIALFAGMIVLRLFAMLWVPLVPEEAYYWMYSRNPELSYFDHPPMVAWVIGLGTWIFGDTAFGVRIVGDLMMCGASVFLFLFARMWFSSVVALVSALALHVLPVYVGVGFVATMDGPLCFFWAMCLFGVSLALRKGVAFGWIIAGLAMGGAMLSKYTGVFLGLGGLLAVVGYRPWRAQLRSMYPYLGAAIALLVFTPVVYWNATHEWASFRFQFLDRFEGRAFNVLGLGMFISREFLVLTPIVMLAFVWFAWRGTRRWRSLFSGRTWFVLSFSVPLLAVMAFKSLRYPIHINWTTPAYLALIPLCVHLLAAWTRQRLAAPQRYTRLAGPTALGWTFLVCSVVNVSMFAFLLFLQPRLNLIHGFGPWEELAAIVEEYEDSYEHSAEQELFIMADGEYRLASVLAFYRMPIEDHEDPSATTSSQWLLGFNGLGYQYWMNGDDLIGRDCLYLDDNDDLAEDVQACFESFEIIDDPRLAALGFQLALCKHYLGPFNVAPGVPGQVARAQ